MTRLIASLFVAFALIVAPLSVSNAAAAMATATACASMEAEAGCPDMERDSEKSCAQSSCISTCAPSCLFPTTSEHHPDTPVAGTFCGPPARLVGLAPEAEPHPSRNISEM